MVSGLYSARDGMVLLQDMVDNTSNNLANVNTTAFKRSLMASMAQVETARDDEQKLRHSEDQWLSENRIVWEQGPLVQTDNPLDVGVEGDGFFMVETPEGTRYTRAGAFTRNADGDLVTMDGLHVLDASGQPIRMDNGALSISADGTVSVDGNPVGQIGLVDFDDRSQLERQGSNLYRLSDSATAEPRLATGQVRQGVLEGSNSVAVEGMIDLIRFSRHYEFDQKAIQSIDETLEKAVNEIGRVQ